jgi:hypothetical protein
MDGWARESVALHELVPEMGGLGIQAQSRRATQTLSTWTRSELLVVANQTRGPS